MLTKHWQVTKVHQWSLWCPSFFLSQIIWLVSNTSLFLNPDMCFLWSSSNIEYKWPWISKYCNFNDLLFIKTHSTFLWCCSTNSWMDSTNLSTGIFLPASPFKRLLRHSYSVRNYFDELPIDEAARAYFIMDFCSFCVPCILKINCIVPILFYVIYIPKYHTKTLNLPQNRLYFQRPQSFL